MQNIQSRIVTNTQLYNSIKNFTDITFHTEKNLGHVTIPIIWHYQMYVFNVGNKISRITAENWRGLENSLQTLRLGRNAIEKLPADAFAGLIYLETLDLRENSLREIDSSVFRDGMAHLTHLYLNDNQFTYVPYSQLSQLKRMKVLDLSYNRISRMLQMQQEPEIRGIQMSLDVLRLDYNQIEILTSGDFQHFYKVNRTYLSGNPLMIIEVRLNYKPYKLT